MPVPELIEQTCRAGPMNVSPGPSSQAGEPTGEPSPAGLSRIEPATAFKHNHQAVDIRACSGWLRPCGSRSAPEPP